MPTDDERREVARRLRETKAECEERGYPWMRDDLILALGYDHDYEAGNEIFALLADLIEPNRGSGGRTILCAHCESASWCGCEPGDEEGGCDFEPRIDEGEPPCNLYSLYEAVLRRHPRDEYAIDDDEVRELVNELLDICNAPGHDVIQRPQPSCDRDALRGEDGGGRMISDDERREVARRLRGLRPSACFDDVYEALGAYGPSPYESRGLSATGLARHLADLIEPDHVGGSNKKVDRDALLELASSMSVRRSWISAADAERGKVIARRIREALGVCQ